MAVITKVSKKAEGAVEYPCLMESGNGRIVLFHRRNEGTIVQAKHRAEIGMYSEDWIMDSFRPFNGTVALSNHV